MSAYTEGRCDTCRFSRPSTKRHRSLECRYHPPAPQVYAGLCWPLVDPDDWCRQWTNAAPDRSDTLPSPPNPDDGLGDRILAAQRSNIHAKEMKTAWGTAHLSDAPDEPPAGSPKRDPR